jgi:hypothetical protein
MGKIALLPYDYNIRGKYLDNIELPNNYMGDFTLMGFLVDRYQEAVAILTSAGYRLEKLEAGIDIQIETPGHLLQMKALLTANDISFDFSDIADTIYQA